MQRVTVAARIRGESPLLVVVAAAAVVVVAAVVVDAGSFQIRSSRGRSNTSSTKQLS